MHAIASVALLMAAILAFMNGAILPAADSHISARNAARDCFRLNPSGENVAIFGLTRDWRYGMNYYFGRELPEWAPGATVPEWLLVSEPTVIDLKLLGIQFQQVSRVGAPDVLLLHVPPAKEDSP